MRALIDGLQALLEGWNADDHPREPEGSSSGGRFTSKRVAKHGSQVRGIRRWDERYCKRGSMGIGHYFTDGDRLALSFLNDATLIIPGLETLPPEAAHFVKRALDPSRYTGLVKMEPEAMRESAQRRVHDDIATNRSWYAPDSTWFKTMPRAEKAAEYAKLGKIEEACQSFLKRADPATWKVTTGSLYEVRIPGPEHLLDCRKPMKEQTPAVRAAYTKFLAENPVMAKRVSDLLSKTGMTLDDMNGREAYTFACGVDTSKEQRMIEVEEGLAVSAALSAAGIPGHTYSHPFGDDDGVIDAYLPGYVIYSGADIEYVSERRAVKHDVIESRRGRVMLTTTPPSTTHRF